MLQKCWILIGPGTWSERICEVSEGGESVNEMVGHVEELKLVGCAGEGCAHDQMHLNCRQHGPQRVELWWVDSKTPMTL